MREAVVAHAGLDFDAAGSGFQTLHRREGGRDVYFVFNPAKTKVEAEVGFRAAGGGTRLDAWTGGRSAVTTSTSGGMVRTRLCLGGGEAALLVFDPVQAEARTQTRESAARGAEAGEVLPLSETWQCEVEPTLDNRFGDFRRPPSEGCMGAEARRFRYAEEPESGGAEGWMRPEHDDGAWPVATTSFGQRMWCLGPLPAGTNTQALERDLAGALCINNSTTLRVGGREFSWKPYEFSTRWGVESDPHLKDWASGPHGLKGEVPDEFIDLHTDEAGAVWLLWTAVEVDAARKATLTTGSRSSYAAWLNGERVLVQDDELPPGRQSIWNLPHYRCEPQARDVALRAGANPLLLRVVQPAGQRVRAFAAFAPPEGAPKPELALRWFAAAGQPAFDPRPEQAAGATWYRFVSAPGLRALRVVSRGPCAAWAEGVALAATATTRREDGLIETRFAVAQARAGCSHVALRVEPVRGAFGCAALAEPVGMECGAGELRAGDWCGQGLEHYSCRVWYRQTLRLTAEQAGRALGLELGGVAATAEVWVNGRCLANLIAPPWRVPVAGVLRPGENRIEIRVANTLANYFHVGIPTPYAPREQTMSGLLGPVRFSLRTA